MFKRKELLYLLITVILFSVKTYIVYRFVFDLHITNGLQEVILFINPFITSFILFGLSVWFKTPKTQIRYIRYVAFFGTLLILINIIFYRAFTDFLTLPQLFQTNNFSDLTSSIFTLVKFTDIFLFTDVVIIWYVTKRINTLQYTFTRRNKVFMVAFSFLLLSGNLLLAEIERPQLLTRAFDREYLVKSIGLFNYHIYDIGLQSKKHAQKVLAASTDIEEIMDYVNNEVRSKEQSELFGVAKDKNIIFISAESMQSFVIDAELHGEEVTPFLNSLVRDDDTFYFENFYHQTEQGKTSDSEFIVENSLYPLPGGAVFYTHAENDFHSFSEIINKNGYSSNLFHVNNNTFWNRNQMYPALGINTYFDIESYEIGEGDSIGWGLKDKLFFSQSMPYLQELEAPFFAKMITITNHYPFDIGEEDRSIDPYTSGSQTLNKYFPTVRYTDEAIEEFFEMLKTEGLYEDSIIVIMGDHEGISANHHRALAEYLDVEEITPYDNIQLQRVPLFIHIPGYGEASVKTEVTGQIDLKPTLLHLLGIDTSNDIYFGNDMFHDDRKGFIALRNGEFISEDYVYTAGMCYERLTGEPIEEDPGLDVEELTPCDDLKEIVVSELNYSDLIIYGDLFRFVNFGEK